MAYIPVSELFGPVIQGEGALIGRPSIFVRTGGCDYRCQWCDTMYSVENVGDEAWQYFTPAQLMREIERLSPTPVLVTLTGGNPALHSGLGQVVRQMRGRYFFGCETQGSISAPWFHYLDYLILSPKPPSSGMQTDWDTLEDCASISGPERSLKVVVKDEADYQFAKKVARIPLPMYLQPCNTGSPMLSYKWLADQVLRDNWHDVIVLPQLHILAWGPGRGK